MVTATLLNAQLRDPLVALGGVWNVYTPTLGGFTLGNGSTGGAYLQVGKLVIFHAYFVFGSTSAAATAAPTLTLPVTAISTARQLFQAAFWDSSAGAPYSAYAANWSSTTVVTMYTATGEVWESCTTSTPFTWATDDAIYVSGTYEAA